MSTATLVEVRKTPLVGMTQMVFLKKPEQVHTVVGSCIALTLYHSRCGLGAMAHIVLAESAGRPGPPGKFADTAVPTMIETLNAQGANTAGLVAKMTGGASMFGTGGPIQVGNQNIAAVTEQLERFRVPLVGEHVAGKSGRRVTFDCQSGDVTVEIVGCSAEVL